MPFVANIFSQRHLPPCIPRAKARGFTVVVINHPIVIAVIGERPACQASHFAYSCTIESLLTNICSSDPLVTQLLYFLDLLIETSGRSTKS